MNEAGEKRGWKWTALLATGVACGVFIVYLSTAARGPWWGDGLELTAAAQILGVPHPTGYPLFMLLGHALLRVATALEPHFALTLFCAGLMAAGTGLLVPVVRRAVLESTGADECGCGMRGMALAAGVALLPALAWTAWEHATMVEVYPLTWALGMGVVAIAWPPAGRVPGLRRQLLLGLTLGLATLNHYSILALYPLAALASLEWGWRAPRRRWGGPLVALAAWAAMLPGYLYLPLRARANPPINWGDPSTLENLRWVLSGGQYGLVNRLRTEQSGLEGIARWLRWWGEQWLPHPAGAGLATFVGMMLVGVAAAGLVLLARRRPAQGIGLLAALLATLAFSVFYRIVDIDAYFLLALPAAAVGWVEACAFIVGRLRLRDPGFLARPGFAALPALLAVAVALMHQRPVDISWDDSVESYGGAVLERLPPGAVVMTLGDNPTYALWYMQMARGLRPDVSVVAVNFISQPWYARYFESEGRPALPVRMAGGLARGKLDYDLELAAGVILPILGEGLPLYTTHRDAIYEGFFRPRPVAGPLLAPGYAAETRYLAAMLPEPYLYRLNANPQLAGMSREELRSEFMALYLRLMRQGAISPLEYAQATNELPPGN